MSANKNNEDVRRALGFNLLKADSCSDRAYAVYKDSNSKVERYSMRNNSTETVTVVGVCKHQTANAILWVCADEVPIDLQAEPHAHTVGIWIPFSHVTEIHPDRLVITRWMATQKGIE